MSARSAAERSTRTSVTVGPRVGSDARACAQDGTRRPPGPSRGRRSRPRGPSALRSPRVVDRRRGRRLRPPGRRPAVLRRLLPRQAGRARRARGANGVGKSTLLRCLAGELDLEQGEIALGGRAAFMRQDVGVGADAGTVRELLLAQAPHALAQAGRAMLESERALADGADPAEAGMRLGEAIGTWSDLGGYELQARWDAACRAIVGAGFDDVADWPTTSLSGGERKRLVLEVLFGSDADIVLLDEPDNFLDIPAKRALEARIVASPKTVLLISYDRDLLAAATRTTITLEGRGAWVHGGSYAGYPEAREHRRRLMGDGLRRWNEEE